MPIGPVLEEDGFHPATVVLSCRNRKDEEDQETLQPHTSTYPTFFYLLSFAPPLPSLIKSPKAFFDHPIILYIIGTICAMLGGFSSFPVLDLIFGVYWSNRISNGASYETIHHASNFAGGIAIATAVGCLLLTWAFQVCFSKASDQLTKRLRHCYVASVLSQDASYFDIHGAGEVATHAGKEMHTIRIGLGEKLGFTIWTMTVLTISLIIGFSVAAKVAGFLFTSVPLIVIVFGLLGVATEKVGAPALRLEGRASSYVEEIFGSMRIVQSFGMSKGLMEKYDKDMLAKAQGYGQRKAFIRGLEAGVVYLALFTVYSAAFWFIGVHTANGTLQLGNGLTAFWNLVNALFSFSMSVPQISNIFEAMSAIRLVRRAIERQPKIDVRDRSGLQIEDSQLIPEFELQNVNFAYASRSHSHSLRNVSVKLDVGKVTALVGPSGSGKSTITSLLLREYDPETANIAVASDAEITAKEEKEDAKAEKKSSKIREKELTAEEKAERAEQGALESKPVEIVKGGGFILYSGQDVRKLNLRWLRSQIAIVRQDPQIFTASIFENVAAGLSGTEWAYRPDVDGSKDANEDVQARTQLIRQKVIDALRKAQALAFVEKLPEGMDTEVSGGKTGLLSGGQRQRISLARALVRQPKVLVIDEGTSAIDSNTEEKIRLMLQEEHKQRGMTVCLIAHRLSTVEKADKIVVMKNGSVVDQGTHKELMQPKRKDQTYRSMIMHQRALVETNDADESSLSSTEQDSSRPRSPTADHPLSDASTTLAPASTIGSFEPSLPLVRQRLPVRRASDFTGWTVSGRSISFGQTEHAAETPSSLKTENLKLVSSPIAPVEDTTHLEKDRSPTTAEQGSAKVESHPKELRKNFIKLVLKHKYEFIIGVSGAIVAGIVFPAMGLVTGENVNSLNAPTPDLIRKGTRLWALIALCLAFADLFIVLIQSFALESASEKTNRHLKRTALSSLMKQEIGFFDSRDNASGALAADLTTHPANVTAATGLVLSQILISTVNLLGSVVLAFVLSWKTALVTLSPVVVLFVTGWLNVTMLEKYESSLQGPSSSAASFISENVDAIKEVVALGRERETLRIFEEQAKSKSPKQTKFLIFGAGGFAVSQAAVYATASLVFFYGGKLRADGELSYTALYAIFEAAIIGIFSAGRVFTFTSDFGRAAASFKTLCGWYERKANIQTLEKTAEKQTESWLGQDIVFKDVELRYPRRPNHPAISNLNLTIHTGQSHAFCGTSGSGKSTILQMVQRFYDPHCGTITVGGQDIRSIDLDELRNEMSYVSQDACLYDGSIAFNLRLGAAKGQQVSQEEIEACCEEACIADFIRGLPKGYDTEIGHKGAQLSGGQKQRICIARALIKRPKMILLDEATSALDAQSEVSVQRALDNASVGRTTLTVAHRLSTIRNCDVIHVVEDGAIVESGTHADLVHRRGRYLQLIEAQI